MERYVKAGKVRKKRRGLIGVSRDSLRALYGDACYICGEGMLFNPKHHDDPLYATVEHIVPRSKGGQTTWHNCKLAHFVCNNNKKDMDLEEYLQYRESS